TCPPRGRIWMCAPTSSPRSRAISRFAAPASRRGTRTERAVPSRRPSRPHWRWVSRLNGPFGARVLSSKAPSATRRRSAPVMDRSTISGGYTEVMASGHSRVMVTPAALDVADAAAAVAGPRDGAVATFVGLVRDHNAGRRVLWLDYEAYAPLAVRTFEQIGTEAAARWPDARVAIHHRTGRVDVGEASVAIAAASPHRADAVAACRY